MSFARNRRERVVELHQLVAVAPEQRPSITGRCSRDAELGRSLRTRSPAAERPLQHAERLRHASPRISGTAAWRRYRAVQPSCEVG